MNISDIATRTAKDIIDLPFQLTRESWLANGSQLVQQAIDEATAEKDAEIQRYKSEPHADGDELVQCPACECWMTSDRLRLTPDGEQTVCDICLLRDEKDAENERLRDQRNELQDARSHGYSRCPECGLPVEMTGCISSTGDCRCGYLLGESDWDPIDPVGEIERLREACQRAVAELLIVLPYTPTPTQTIMSWVIHDIQTLSRCNGLGYAYCHRCKHVHKFPAECEGA